MHRFEVGKQEEGIQESIANLQKSKVERSKIDRIVEELQQTLKKEGRREDTKGLLLNLGRRLEKAGVSEKKFAEFLRGQVKSEFALMWGMTKAEWLDALDGAADPTVARESISKKAKVLESMVNRGKALLAIAYCLENAYGERGGVRGVFSNIGKAEAEILFRRGEKEADEFLEKLTKKEVSEVYRKLAFGD